MTGFPPKFAKSCKPTVQEAQWASSTRTTKKTIINLKHILFNIVLLKTSNKENILKVFKQEETRHL